MLLLTGMSEPAPSLSNASLIWKMDRPSSLSSRTFSLQLSFRALDAMLVVIHSTS